MSKSVFVGNNPKIKLDEVGGDLSIVGWDGGDLLIKGDDDDLRFDHDNVGVVIDPASFQHLKGAKLDYKDGLQETGFSISNPNAERSCGCGQSFS
jgi:Fe-S cluster assembly iron-binding protein IscA